jgi:hypothetical protein
MVVKLGRFTLREERRLRVFENKVLRRISGFRRDKVTGRWNFMLCTPHKISLG